MLAAREGDVDAIELLIEKGATANITTKSGHSAYDIAVFWSRAETAKILKPLEISVLADNFFSSDRVERNSIRRSNSDWVRETLILDTTQFILMRNAEPVVCYKGNLSPKAKLHAVPDLFITAYTDVHHLIADSLDNIIYLGHWAPDDANLRKKGEKLIEKNIFAVDVSELSKDDLSELFPSVEVLPALPGLMRLNPDHASLTAQARSLLDWHYRYSFCPTCGSKTTMADSGYKRSCTNKSCSTHTGGRL
jgi:NAD+ diphosphatase